MISIHETKEIILDSGYSEFEVDASDAIALNFKTNSTSEVFLRIKNATEITLHTITEANSSLTFLVWNEALAKVIFEENHEVKQNGLLSLAYAEIIQAETERKAKVLLVEEGASASVSSATLTSVKKHFELVVQSQASHTYGEMKNYSVVLDHGDYRMEATGAIDAGAIKAESHQISRALCFDPSMNAKIVPILLIDENDVKASHATSVGRMDEEQMYYMQSRGLTPSQCTALISTGYLMPITEVIHDETMKATLKKELEEKISELCSM